MTISKPETHLILIGLPITGEVIHAASIRGVRVIKVIGESEWRVLVQRENTSAAALDCDDKEHADQVAHRVTTDWRSGLREYALLQALGGGRPGVEVVVGTDPTPDMVDRIMAGIVDWEARRGDKRTHPHEGE